MSAGQGKIFSPGTTIQDKWVILEFIDKGAFGEVYRAHQLNLQRDVAIKVVSQEWRMHSSSYSGGSWIPGTAFLVTLR